MNRTTRTIAVGVAASLSLALTACGGSKDSSSSSSDKISIGIKFDQPGLGLQEGSKYTGFDVEVATYVAKELGYEADKIQFKQTPSAQRESMIEGGQVKLIFATYSINDARKQKVSFGGPYFIAGQDLLVRADDNSITGPDSLKGKKLCSVTGSTPAQKIADKYPGVDLSQQDTYSKCVAALAAGSLDAVTTDNVILAGYASQPQYKGKLKLIGKPFTTERYGVGLKKGDTALCKQVNTALEKMITTGAWEKALTETVGASGFTYDKATNPPKMDTCS